MFTNEGQNIVAIATPGGTGALAVIRISGKALQNTYRLLTKKEPKNRYAVFTKIYHPKKKTVLDKSIVTYFKAPKSFTGEDVLEISCHGGINVKRSIVEACNSIGIKNAARGEFSYRAFMNGKIDLIQAEAVCSLITSKSARPAHYSLMHIEGKVSKNLKAIKNEIIDVLAIIENELNFSEEEISHTSLSSISKTLEGIKIKIDDILSSSAASKKIFNGVRVVLLGRPNVGKSTLFNNIIGENKALTSNEAGTTRDTVEAWFELEGVPVCLIDTAGIWEAEKGLDRLGVKKTLKEIKIADICLLIDDQNPFDLFKSKNIKEKNLKQCILVRSKSDLKKINIKTDNKILNVCSKNNDGIKELLTKISSSIVNTYRSFDDDNVMITQRQFKLLEKASGEICLAVEQAASGWSPDIIASTLHGFVYTMREVVGEVQNEDVINKIFSEFCVGK